MKQLKQVPENMKHLIPDEGFITYVDDFNVFVTPENYVEARVNGDHVCIYSDGTMQEF